MTKLTAVALSLVFLITFVFSRANADGELCYEVRNGSNDYACFDTSVHPPKKMFDFSWRYHNAIEETEPYSGLVSPVFSCGLVPAFDRKANKHGYVDRNASFVIPPSFDRAMPFHDDRAVVINDGKFAMIDQKSKQIVPYGKYKYVLLPSDGLAGVIDENMLLGFVNLDGELVIPCKYRVLGRSVEYGGYVSAFSDGIAVVRKPDSDNIVCINTKGEEVKLPGEPLSICGDELIAVRDNGGENYCDKNGELLLDEPVEYAGVFREGLAFVRDADRKYKCIDTLGKTVFDLKEGRIPISRFYNGHAAVSIGDDRWTYVGTSGEVSSISFSMFFSPLIARYVAVFAAKPKVPFRCLFSPERGIIECSARVPRTTGLLAENPNSRERRYSNLLWTELNDAQTMHVLSHSVSHDDPTKEYFFGNSDREYVSDISLSSLELFEKNNRWGYRNQDKEVVIRAKYTLAWPFVGEHAVVCKGSNEHVRKPFVIPEDYVIIDKFGNEVYESEARIVYFGGDHFFEYDELSGNYVPYTLDGNVIGEQMFSEVRPFSEGLALVASIEEPRKRGTLSLVNNSLNVVGKLAFEDGTVFADGMCPVKLKGKWGYINRNGALVIEPVFSEAHEFFMGRAIVRTEEGAFVIDKRGRVLSRCYDWISPAPISKAWARYEDLLRSGGVFRVQN